MSINGIQVGWVWAGGSCVRSDRWVASTTWAAGGDDGRCRIFSSLLDALDWMVSILLENN